MYCSCAVLFIQDISDRPSAGLAGPADTKRDATSASYIVGMQQRLKILCDRVIPPFKSFESGAFEFSSLLYLALKLPFSAHCAFPHL